MKKTFSSLIWSGKNEKAILPHTLEELLFQFIFECWVPAVLRMFIANHIQKEKGYVFSMKYIKYSI